VYNAVMTKRQDCEGYILGPIKQNREVVHPCLRSLRTLVTLWWSCKTLASAYNGSCLCRWAGSSADHTAPHGQ